MPAFALRGFAVFACLCLVAACAAKRPDTGVAPAADTLWQRFSKQRLERSNASAFLAFRASMNYVSPQRSGRALLTFRGNRDYPMLMEVSAGIGATALQLYEDARGLTAVPANDGQLRFFPDPRAGAEAIGPGLPFSLRDLAVLLAGDLTGVAPSTYVDSANADDAGRSYGFGQDSAISSLTLDQLGRPVRLAGHDWTMDLERYEAIDQDPPIATKLTFLRPPDVKAVFRIKSLERGGLPLPAEEISFSPMQ